jgi:ABC-type lipoprotein export system ATPase subunit
VIAVTHEPGFAEATERNINLVDGEIERDRRR